MITSTSARILAHALGAVLPYTIAIGAHAWISNYVWGSGSQQTLIFTPLNPLADLATGFCESAGIFVAFLALGFFVHTSIVKAQLAIEAEVRATYGRPHLAVLHTSTSAPHNSSSLPGSFIGDPTGADARAPRGGSTDGQSPPPPGLVHEYFAELHAERERLRREYAAASDKLKDDRARLRRERPPSLPEPPKISTLPLPPRAEPAADLIDRDVPAVQVPALSPHAFILKLVATPTFLYLATVPLLYLMLLTLNTYVSGQIALQELALQREIAAVTAAQRKWDTVGAVATSWARVAEAKASERRWGVVGEILGGVVGWSLGLPMMSSGLLSGAVSTVGSLSGVGDGAFGIAGTIGSTAAKWFGWY